MGDVIGLQDRQLIENQEFVSDLARFSESLLTEKFIRRKYGKLDEASWTRLAENEELISAVEDEKIRRMRDGSTKREIAQKHIVRGPEILNSIASDVSASPRHRVDALKTLDGMAATTPESAPMSDRFIISIILNSDGSGSEPQVLHFDKSRAIDPHDGDDTDNVPHLAAIAAKKPTENGGGQESI
jgi:hypothetical protein